MPAPGFPPRPVEVPGGACPLRAGQFQGDPLPEAWLDGCMRRAFGAGFPALWSFKAQGE